MWKKYTKCELILWSGPALSTKVRNSLLAVLAFVVLLPPTHALAAERVLVIPCWGVTGPKPLFREAKT